MLCDSGTTHHMLSNMMFFACLRDEHLEDSWDDFSTSCSLGIGHLILLGKFSSARSGLGPGCAGTVYSDKWH